MKTVNHIRLTPDDMEKVIPTPHLNLCGIIEDACYRPKAGHPYLLFSCHVEDYRNRKCRFCGSTAVHAHGQTGAPRRIHDVNSGRTKVDIDLTVQRYICSECGRSFSPPSPDIMESRHLTRRLYDEIRHEAFTKPLSTVALKYRYSDTIIGKIFDQYSKDLDSAHGPVIAPRVLGIDEKHIVHNMRAIFTDIENRVLLEMCPDNKKDTVIATIESMVGYDTNIEVVTMDMSCGYRTYVQECLPNAAIVVDKFHVCQSVYEKIAKARSKIMAYIGALIQAEPEGGAKKQMIAVRNLAQTNTYLFKFNAKNLAKSERRISAMANICATFPEFNHLRLIKERFDRIYTAPDRRTAEAYCKEWAELIPPSGCRQIEAWKKRFEVEPELFGRFLSREEPLPPVMLGAMAHRWEVLRQENAPLRAVVNGRVRSVGEDFYDEMIRRHLPEGQTKIANIIGEVLGREKPGIGDVWLAERIRQMLSTGELRMLREDRERFYRSVVERT